ncbi:MAG: hypothetical protein RL375_1100, partial [Pseudomonadota bacterium]
MPARRRHLTVAAALCLVALLGLAGPTRVDAAQAGAGAAPAPSRAGPLSALNAGMTPLALDIALTPHFDAQGVSTRFDAQARLSLTATAALQSIELHALDLQVLSASIDGVSLPAPTVLAERQRLRFKLARPLTKGRHELQINYRGLIGLAPQGLFRIGLPERDRQPHAGLGQAQVLATQMEPADARRLAPMIDEPGVRIPYTLSVTVPAGLTVVANTELVEQVPAPAPAGSTVVAPGRATPSPTPLVTWRFAPTPPMASYLIGLFIGEFEHVEDLSARPALRVYTVPGKREQGRMALRLARQLVSHYEDYFGQPYPLSKLDQIALPGGFEGGMENWGAIAYHESALLFDAASSPPDRYRRVWNLVSHEVAHQWFGNLVTMAWWDDLWLNEAFASWMAARATEALTGDASVWSDTQRPLQATMGSDALATALPVIRPVDDDRAAFSSFDDITYHKGMAFVRQLETRLGAEPFRDGLRRYMATHRLGTTRAADLWQALEAASARPVASLADAWLRRPGLPEVTLRARCAGGQTRIDLTQRRFLLDPPRQAGRDSAMLWPLTLELARFDPQGERLDHHTVDLDQAQATLTLPGCGGALKLKPGGAGFYRAAYGQPLRDANPPTAAANGPRAAARPPGLTARRPDVTPAAVPPDEIDLLGALQAVLHRLPEADRVDLIG